MIGLKMDKKITPETKITDAGFNCRARNILAILGVETLRDISRVNKDTLSAVGNCGKKTVDEIRRVAGEAGVMMGLTEKEALKMFGIFGLSGGYCPPTHDRP